MDSRFLLPMNLATTGQKSKQFKGGKNFGFFNYSPIGLPAILPGLIFLLPNYHLSWRNLGAKAPLVGDLVGVVPNVVRDKIAQFIGNNLSRVQLADGTEISHKDK